MSDRCQACGLGWLTNFLCLKFVRGLRAHKPSTQPFSRAWVALIRAWHETRMALSDLQEGNSYEWAAIGKRVREPESFLGKQPAYTYRSAHRAKIGKRHAAYSGHDVA